MEPVKIPTSRNLYMREYKKKEYQLKGDEIKFQKKRFYYKKKLNLTNDQIAKYEFTLPFVCIFLSSISDFVDTKPDQIQFFKDLFNEAINFKISNPDLKNDDFVSQFLKK
jgi:hypothetical protein